MELVRIIPKLGALVLVDDKAELLVEFIQPATLQ